MLLALFMASSILAAPFKNVPHTITQPNGQIISCFVSGDEFFNYCHDANGYTIIQDPETGYYTYAIQDGDDLKASSYIVGQVNPSACAALVPGLVENPEKTMARRLEHERMMRQNRPMGLRTQNQGTMNNIVVFISFSDDTSFYQTFSQVESMFNDTSSVSASSMRNYFRHVSYEQLDMPSHFFPAPVENVILSYKDQYPTNYYKPYSSTNPAGYNVDDYSSRHERESALLANALHYVQNMIPSDLNLDYNNDNFVDNVVFVVNANVTEWSTLLWPHRSSLISPVVYLNGKRVLDYNFQLANSSYLNVGTLCHEMFHSLSAPDLYNYEGSSVSFVGTWDLMESTTDYPQNMGAYMKYKYGYWIDEIPEADQNGLYTIHSVATSKNCAYKIYPDRVYHPNQFFLIEYRKMGDPFDQTSYGTGAVIYRINDEYDGNASVNFETIFAEVYAYRKGGEPYPEMPAYPSPGNMNQSYFGEEFTGEFSEYTDPYMFYTNGTSINGVRITDIKVLGDSLQFRLVKGSTTIDSYPWTESFEEGHIPESMHYEFETQNRIWTVAEGNATGSLDTAHSGHGNALFYATASCKTKLVMPTFDFRFLTNPNMSFWYAQKGSGNYLLKVYYRSNPDDEWILLNAYQNQTQDWVQQTITLPNPSSTYQIAFEVGGSNGTGLVIDDIMVYGTPITEFAITASTGENGQVTPAGHIVVPIHCDTTFHFTPNPGYTVDQILVDGENQGQSLDYTFTNVEEDHSLAVSFRLAQPALSAVPNSLFFSTAAGEISTAKDVYVQATDITEDINIQVEAPFLISTDQNDYGLQATLPYSGGYVHVVFAPEWGGTYNKQMTISSQSQSAIVTLKGSATGIKEWKSDFELYPNPAGDVLHITFENNDYPENIEILDICGRQILSYSVVNNYAEINISNLNAGIYFLKADNSIQKFIKK